MTLEYWREYRPLFHIDSNEGTYYLKLITTLTVSYDLLSLMKREKGTTAIRRPTFWYHKN
jgi:hypothetical protein